MRPSLTELQQTEQYLRGEMKQEDAAVFETLVLTNPLLKVNVHFLRKAFSLLNLYNRKKLKEEIAVVHHKLFTDPQKTDFQKEIQQLFNTQ